MLLYEVFNQPKKWQWVRQSHTSTTALFQIGNILYEFNAELLWGQTDDDDNSIPDMWYLSFSPAEEQEYKNAYGKTGTGNQQQVFATVIDIIRDFMNEYKPQSMTMSAEEPNRKTLYIKMLKKLLPNWNISFDGDHIIVKHPGVS